MNFKPFLVADRPNQIVPITRINSETPIGIMGNAKMTVTDWRG